MLANHNRVSPGYLGLSAGIRIPVVSRWNAEVGLGFYQTQSLTLSGKVYQYNRLEFYNMNYNYKISNRRLMLEGKLLTEYASLFHPYITAGIGINRNRSYAYQEIPFQNYAVPDPAFTSATEPSLSYSLGLGVDVDIDKHWRLGVGYSYSSLGAAQLSTSPAQLTSQKITTGSIQGNQFMLQVTYAMS